MPSRRSSSVGSGTFQWRSAAEVPPAAWPSSGVLSGDWFSEHHKAAQRWPSLLASKGHDLYFSCHCGFHSGPPLHQGSQTTAPGPQSNHPLSACINRVSLNTAVLLHLLLPKAASVPAWQRWGAATETTEPQRFNIWTFTEQVWSPALDVGLIQRCNTQHGPTARLGPAQWLAEPSAKWKRKALREKIMTNFKMVTAEQWTKRVLNPLRLAEMVEKSFLQVTNSRASWKRFHPEAGVRTLPICSFRIKISFAQLKCYMGARNENQNQYGSLLQPFDFGRVTSRLWLFLECFSFLGGAGGWIKNKTHWTPWKQHFPVTWQTDACFDMTESGQISPDCQLCSLQLLFLYHNHFSCHNLFIHRLTCSRVTSPGFQIRRDGSPSHFCPFLSA